MATTLLIIKHKNTQYNLYIKKITLSTSSLKLFTLVLSVMLMNKIN